MVGSGWAEAARRVSRGRRNRTAHGPQNLHRQWMRRHPNGQRWQTCSNQIGNPCPVLHGPDQRQRPRPQRGQGLSRGWQINQRLGLVPIRDMHDQGIERGPVFRREYPRDCGAIGCIRAQAVNRFRRKRDHAPCPQDLCRHRNPCLIGGQVLGRGHTSAPVMVVIISRSARGCRDVTVVTNRPMPYLLGQYIASTATQTMLWPQDRTGTKAKPMTYRVPVDEMIFCAEKIIGQTALADTEKFGEATNDTRAAILEEAAKMAEGALVPVNRNGDLHPARLENGVVRCSPGYKEAYDAIAEGGWIGLSADPEFGGMGLPISFATYLNEMMASACLSLSLNPLMTQGQIEALESHGSDEIKATYLPKLISGEWNGTMNLTEPQAGSDVGALTTKAEPNGDGSYAISGQKIYISWGDHDLNQNICHLVLARLPDGVPGTKGISLFIVPKFIPDADGEPGVANTLKPISLEHKLGLHGSPTAVMEYDKATGWMVGPENGGMAAMFTMMNNARLGVGVEGLGVAEAATQKAIAYALDRKQGRTADGSDSIIGHADVRRMLMTMKALTSVARAICYDTAFSLDLGQTGDAAHKARGAFLTPIAKAMGTEIGMEVAQIGIQVHGGMGFVEETGAAQFARDVRVTAIYEGTNGIQAMDLVGRKLGDGGVAATALLDEIAETAATVGGPAGAALKNAHLTLAATTEWMLKAPELNDRFAGATPFLKAWGLTLGAHYLLKGAAVDPARAQLAEFFTHQILPRALADCAAATHGAAPLYALDVDALSA